MRANRAQLVDVYRRLNKTYGDRGWWPAQDGFEMAVGAILVQGVTWSGAAQAVASLRERGLHRPKALASASAIDLYPLIRPARFFRQKARALSAFAAWVMTYGGDLDLALSGPWPKVRESLLRLPRIGPETADAIGVYAGHRPVAMADAHTERILRRLGMYTGPAGYESVAQFLAKALGDLSDFDYGDFHAQMDGLGHAVCKSRPHCAICPLKSVCATGGGR